MFPGGQWTGRGVGLALDNARLRLGVDVGCLRTWTVTGHGCRRGQDTITEWLRAGRERALSADIPRLRSACGHGLFAGVDCPRAGLRTWTGKIADFCGLDADADWPWTMCGCGLITDAVAVVMLA